MRRYQLKRGAIVLLLAFLPAAAASAQDAGTGTQDEATVVPEGDTTTSSTSSTTVPEQATTTTSTVPTTTTTAPPATTTTTVPAPAEPHAFDDPDEVGAEVPPSDPIVVPPREQPRLPTLQDSLTSQQITSSLSSASSTLAQVTELAQQAAVRAVALEAELGRKQLRLDELKRGKQLAQLVLEQKREAVRRRAVTAYTNGGIRHVNSLLEVRDIQELQRRMAFIATITEQDQKALEAYTGVRDASTADLGKEEAAVETARALAADARRLAGLAGDVELQRRRQIDALTFGGTIVTDGFAFPVDDPHNFIDTFGAPRMPGTPYEHRHQGTDIFAPEGTGLRAMERGVITRMGTDLLGGTKLWLVGASGTRYYYAHLSGYAPGIAEGSVVDAGDLVGFVGRTGNARRTPAHLHIELHPNGGPAINPYPLLKAVDDAARAARLAVPTPLG
ncbi:MAG TPA: M23 family metallopeptidase [Acidimicrobiales bacterium]|jgi:murein DD-endopeptidase MepM/ murein hydrolase activator NlpD